jgi:hypothetical protein
MRNLSGRAHNPSGVHIPAEVSKPRYSTHSLTLELLEDSNWMYTSRRSPQS